MAYGARLESVLGASPRGFESPILRHRTPGPVEVPGFLLPAAPPDLQPPRVLPALMGRAAVCAGGRRPAREPSFRVLLLVVPLVFRAPSGPAAREIATRELRSEWSISKPARALRSLRRPPHRRHLCCLDKPGQAPPPPTGTAARPCSPRCQASGVLWSSAIGRSRPAEPRPRPP